MVCLGNICRSPLAQGVAEHYAKENGLDWIIDSAGTSSWHVGEKPDPRSIRLAIEKGIDISSQRSRQISATDLDEFDLVLAMDSSNYGDIASLAVTEEQKEKIKLILNYLHPDKNMAVPDPYYDGNFEGVYNLLKQAVECIPNE